MNKSLPERRPFLLLVILLSSLLVVMSYQVQSPRGTSSLLEDTLLNLAGPLIRGASGSVGFAAGLWNSYVDLRGTRGENLRLRAELERLEERGRQAEEFRRENLRLREVLDLRKTLAIPSLAADVMTLGLSGQSRTALVNRGSRDGVRRDLAVINRHGVVGRVIAAGKGVAKLQLLIDPNSGVAGIIQRTRGQGMVIGMGDQGCRMEYVSELEDVEVGDVVVTSGLDRIYPRGLTIGVVRSVEEGDQLTKNVRIEPEVDFRRLEEVLVLLDSEESRAEAELVP